MVGRFRVLLHNYQQHCISHSAVALHLRSKDAYGMQEVRAAVVVVAVWWWWCLGAADID